ncbi:MAG: hypothetical protein H8E37_01390 [Planctomycetes bacterium]|nr:hypothetical protein [Planctomycetota bacterium]
MARLPISIQGCPHTRLSSIQDGSVQLSFWKHHEATLRMYFAWFNFARKHSTIGTSPAVQSGLTDHVWAIEELLTKAADT